MTLAVTLLLIVAVIGIAAALHAGLRSTRQQRRRQRRSARLLERQRNWWVTQLFFRNRAMKRLTYQPDRVRARRN